MTAPTNALATMTGAEAYAKAVEYALRAAEYAEKNPNSAAAHQLAAVSRAFSGIAKAEVAARAGARRGCYPEGGWKQHTHPDDFRTYGD